MLEGIAFTHHFGRKAATIQNERTRLLNWTDDDSFRRHARRVILLVRQRDELVQGELEFSLPNHLNRWHTCGLAEFGQLRMTEVTVRGDIEKVEGCKADALHVQMIGLNALAMEFPLHRKIAVERGQRFAQMKLARHAPVSAVLVLEQLQISRADSKLSAAQVVGRGSAIDLSGDDALPPDKFLKRARVGAQVRFVGPGNERGEAALNNSRHIRRHRLLVLA